MGKGGYVESVLKTSDEEGCCAGCFMAIFGPIFVIYYFIDTIKSFFDWLAP